MYNCPVVTVSESTFENNHAQSVFTDLPSRVSGGGLSVAIYGRNDSSLMRGAFNYTIQSCTFSNNNASSLVPSAGTFSILEGGHVNGHGGGVAFYMVRSSVIEIKVLGCNFTNNYAPAFGGGLLIFSPETVPEEDFTIAGSYFEGNEAEAGGAISLSVTFLQKGKTEVLTKNVIYTNNVFVRNKARFGGAMYFGPGEELFILVYCTMYAYVCVGGGGGGGGEGGKEKCITVCILACVGVCGYAQDIQFYKV